ncbi:hypothetical protein [Bradyrhizobium sp. th.b2]|uniref:hypothetical protein n=1 Tax=Bradyrhizobium sp. th-b2 TaxID=172088 RepID=UPI000423FBAF|nr:hypothetical protein [Bradyrhizobium sp. th.b2]
MAEFQMFLALGVPATEAMRDRLRVLYSTCHKRSDRTPKQAAILAEAFRVLFTRGSSDVIVIATTEELEAAFEIRNRGPENPPAAPISGIILEFPKP